MYYNIKIKSNGSEFTLESSNKTITQREMDIYFASIFNASEGFKSGLKKIEVNSSRVKSIDEIEILSTPSVGSNDVYKKFEQENLLKFSDTKKDNKITDEKFKPVLDGAKSLKSEDEEPAPIVNAITEAKIEKQKEADFDIPTPTLYKKANEGVVSELKFQNSSKQPEKIDDMISFVQNEIDSVNISDDIFDNNLVDVLAKNKGKQISDNVLKSNTEEENRAKLNDIFTDVNKKEKPKSQISISPSVFAAQKPAVTKSLITDIIEDKKEQFSSFEPLTQITTLAQIESSLEPKNEIVKKDEIAEIPQMTEPADFKSYLSEFKCTDILDEFLICTYYIKNILNQDDFTMKFINSKLFKATGKIADSSIVEKLIEQNYLEAIDGEDAKKYCITAHGEDYFIANFRE